MKKLSALGLSLPLFLLTGAFTQVFAAQQYNQATVTWQTQPNTKCYQIYYKESGAQNWQHAVRCKDLPASSWQYTIKYLKSNTAYTYNVAAVSNNNKQTWLGDHTVWGTSMMQ